jgi:hypothetical protein
VPVIGFKVPRQLDRADEVGAASRAGLHVSSSESALSGHRCSSACWASMRGCYIRTRGGSRHPVEIPRRDEGCRGLQLALPDWAFVRVFPSVVGVKGGAMRVTSLPACSGTVVFHRDDAVTCTSGTCPSDLSKGVWVSLHRRFVRCDETLGLTGPCRDCGFSSAPRVLTSLSQASASSHRLNGR